MPETPQRRLACRKLRRNDLHSTRNNIVLYKQPAHLVRRTQSNFVKVAPFRLSLPLTYCSYTRNTIIKSNLYAHTIFVGFRFLLRMTGKINQPTKGKVSKVKNFKESLVRFD